MAGVLHQKFVLHRKGCISDIPGQPYVAEGVVFSDGRVALAWLMGARGVSVYSSLDAAVKECCADGKTEIVPAERT